MISTSAASGFCKHSNKTPSPTIPVAPVIITLIPGMLLQDLSDKDRVKKFYL